MSLEVAIPTGCWAALDQMLGGVVPHLQTHLQSVCRLAGLRAALDRDRVFVDAQVRGRALFIHPKAMGGVLVELEEISPT